MQRRYGELHNIHRSEVVAGFCFGGTELDLDATGFFQIGGGGIDVPIVLGCPRHAQLHQQGAAVVILVRVLLEEQDGESFLLTLVGDRGEIEGRTETES